MFMRENFRTRQLNSRREADSRDPKTCDYSILFITLMLVLTGVVMVFSSSAVSARQDYHDTYFYLKKEIIFVSVGLFMMFMTKNLPYRHYWTWVYPIFGVTVLMLLITIIFGTGGKEGDVHRWIRIGPFSIQPSEFAKLSAVIFAAYAVTKKREKIKEFAKGFMPIVGLAGIFILLILAQKDLGSAAIIGMIVFLMLFIAGTRLRYLLGSILLSLGPLYFLIFGEEYRRQRIMIFLDPWQDPQKWGFQIIQSLVAFQAGGLTGVGLGEGKQKLSYLPEAHTDFIFSVLGEEIGLVGVLFVIALYTALIFRGLLVALKAKEPFGMYLAFGMTCLIGIQAYINMGMVMGLLPTKGLALPFISYGGSSMLASLIAVGVILNVSGDSGEET